MLSVQLIINYVRGLMIVVVVFFWGEGFEWGWRGGVSLFIRPSADCNRTAMFVSV